MGDILDSNCSVEEGEKGVAIREMEEKSKWKGMNERMGE